MKLSMCKPLAAALLGATLTVAASAAVITKNSGLTTPMIGDFGPQFAGHPTKVGYGTFADNHMFIETFRLECGQGVGVTSATLKLTLKRGGGLSSNDSVSTWTNPTTYTYLYGGTAPAIWGTPAVDPLGSATKTLTSNVTAQVHAMSSPRLSFAVQDDTSVLSASLEYTCAPKKKGLPFGLYPQNTVTGMATAACQGTPGPDCNPYEGDTLCTEQRPLLCMKALGLSAPPGGSDHWSGNVIATTEPMLPAATLSAANNACSTRFGGGWTVAEFHVGGGWKFGAYGDYGNHGVRAWVDVNNQANGNCWTRP